MNVLITGGAGFIGSHLCSALVKDKHNVICIDNETTGIKNTINNLLNNSNFLYINGDISKTVYDLNVDIIFNLACPTPPLFVKNNPELVLDSSNYGILNLIKLAKKYNSKLIHISSIKVLEDNLGTNIYTDAKRISETLVSKYDNSIIIRLASVYGPGMLLNDSRVIPQFILKALNNENLIIWGDGTQLDTFAYIDDIISFLINSINYDNELYTIGSKDIISINDLAKIIIKLAHSHSNTEFLNNFSSTRTLNYLQSISIKYNDTINLANGLINTINHFKQYIDTNDLRSSSLKFIL